jgi:hypothetical protein
LNRLAKLIFWRAGFSELQQPVVAPCDKNELICPSSGKSRARRHSAAARQGAPAWPI